MTQQLPAVGLSPQSSLEPSPILAPQLSPCQACGACCSTSFEWPRFSTETDEALDRIPAKLVDPSLGRMLCIGDRCAALAGEIGVATACTIYADRPEVCRACVPGDDACNIARTKHVIFRT